LIGREGVAVSWGRKSWRVEDWGVPGEGETGAWRTGEWAGMGTLDSSTFAGDDEAWVGLRLACFCPSGVSQAVPSSPNYTSGQRAEEKTPFPGLE